MIPRPTECPVCKSPVQAHSDETDDEFEEVEFECHCILQRQENGKWRAESVCREPTLIALEVINGSQIEGARG